MNRPICVIAQEIRRDWIKVNYGAKPYLEVMEYLNEITDSYGCDSARSIISYFLSNAGTYKGETAKRIKLELNKMIK